MTFKSWNSNPETVPEETLSYEGKWDTFESELSKSQKAALLMVSAKENQEGKYQTDPESIPDPELGLTPECFLAFRYGRGLTEETIAQEQYRGYSICYEGDFSDFVGETQLLIDEILSRSEAFDTFDKIRTLAENLNSRHSEKLNQFVNGSGIMIPPDFEEIDNRF